MFDCLEDEEIRPVWKAFGAQQGFLAEELRRCQQNMIGDEEELTAFKAKLRTDGQETTRLGSSSRAALLHLGRDSTPEEVMAIEQIESKRVKRVNTQKEK